MERAKCSLERLGAGVGRKWPQLSADPDRWEPIFFLRGPKTKKASAYALTSVSFSVLHGAQGGTRTRTLANYPLKVACLPVPPPGHVTNCRHNNAVRRFDSAHYKEIYLTVKNFLRFFAALPANAIDKPFLEVRHKLDKNLPSSKHARKSKLETKLRAKRGSSYIFGGREHPIIIYESAFSCGFKGLS